MSLHNKIMNIKNDAREIYGNVHNLRLVYAEGHRDARHAAAEMALEAEERIEELESALQRMNDLHERMMNECNLCVSALSAETIREMNEAPIQTAKVLRNVKNKTKEQTNEN